MQSRGGATCFGAVWLTDVLNVAQLPCIKEDVSLKSRALPFMPLAGSWL